MKKLFTVIIFALCIFILSGCSNANKKETTLKAVSDTEATLPPTVTVTLPEGFTAVQIAEKLQENGVCSASDFMKEVNNTEKLKGVYKFIDYIDPKNKAFCLEGYIFPTPMSFTKTKVPILPYHVS